MKKELVILIVSFFLVSCSSFIPKKINYTLQLTEVERPADAKEQYGDYKIDNSVENSVGIARYKDELVSLDWTVETDMFGFALKNNSDNSIKIIWDEAVYIDVFGNSGRVIHSGIKFIAKNEPQAPTVIAKKAKITDVIVPADNIYYSSSKYNTGWQKKPLFQSSYYEVASFEKIKEIYLGKEVRVLLPLKIEDVVNEYTFTFKIVDVSSPQAISQATQEETVGEEDKEPTGK